MLKDLEDHLGLASTEVQVIGSPLITIRARRASTTLTSTPSALASPSPPPSDFTRERVHAEDFDPSFGVPVLAQYVSTHTLNSVPTLCNPASVDATRGLMKSLGFSPSLPPTLHTTYRVPGNLNTMYRLPATDAITTYRSNNLLIHWIKSLKPVGCYDDSSFREFGLERKRKPTDTRSFQAPWPSLE
ncbi:hypothetical protein B0H19DRAFT_1233412 [Mycena capillaripes]|nr:hypothetical protein B0H19DRAFT_1233412 [Mycena capillaripes]